MNPKIGVIADDFTGATDIAGFLVENGMSSIQLTQLPNSGVSFDVDCLVVSLKSRSCPSEQAVRDSLAALKWLTEQGCNQLYFKYCSTFDSTAEGNIGPVTDALLDEMNEPFTILCPSLPVNGRTVYNGYLFVFNQLLSDSGMRNHPINPMTESNVVSLMESQSKGKCGLIDVTTVELGSEAIQRKIESLIGEGYRYAIVDALTQQHLDLIGHATKELRLVTGGSGLASGIAKAHLSHSDSSCASEQGYPVKAKSVVLSGSCSVMTNKQVEQYKSKSQVSSFAVDVESCLSDSNYVEFVTQWYENTFDANHLAPIIYATANSEQLKKIQQQYGVKPASEAIETFFEQLAKRLRDNDVRNFIVAGGETSGAVTKGLNINGFHIGPQIAPGVPWVKSLDEQISLALKSGNFGDEHFFEKAQDFWL
ncbi:four-carbon acid sugar kinase family protein [Vibrio sp.]|nr:four-carbon acid sugar kinase family protein [Vibrio sp.]